MELKVADLSQRLSAQAEEVCCRLLPGGKRMNRHWVVGGLSGEAGESLKVNLGGQHAGKWKDWATDEHGDLIDLWCAVNGLTVPDGIAAVRDHLGIPKSPSTYVQRSYSVPPEAPEVAPLNDTGKAAKWLIGKRRLNPEIVSQFKIDGCPEKRAIVFTTYNLKGEIINRSYRTLPQEGQKKKVWQEFGAAPCLYGWHALNKSAFQNRCVIICEGQLDCMTWTQWGYDALSVPNGSGLTWIEYEWDNLAAFDTIYLCFDTDPAGQKNLRNTVQRLGVSRVLIVTIPHKDANEALQQGCTRENAESWMKAAKPPKVDKLVSAKDLKERMLQALEKKEMPFTMPFFKGSDAFDGFYFWPGDVTLWTGASGTGKSTILNYVMLFLVCEEIPIYIASMEMLAEETVLKLVRPMIAAQPTKDQASLMADLWGPFMSLCDVVGYIEQEMLFEQMRFCFQRYGTEHFFIDSLMRIEGLEEEWVLQGKFLNKLQDFAKTTGVHVHLVAHSRKIQEGARASKSDVKGSSLLVNNADNIVSVRRNHEKDQASKDGKDTRGMYDTELSIEKQRRTGWQGAVRLKFNRHTGIFVKM